MEAFPFTDAEWDPLKPVAESVLVASRAGDDTLAASHRLQMLELLDGLRERYGDHPVLLETAADYTEDKAAAVPLYRQAAEVAGANGLPTLSIRTALAFALMTISDPAAALEELRTCGGEAATGSEDERKHWLGLLRYAADYTESDEERSCVYRRAVEIAATHGLPTLFIRLCLVRHLLDAGRPAAAQAELRACRGEVATAEGDDRTWWAGLVAEAGRAKTDSTPDRGGKAEPD